MRQFTTDHLTELLTEHEPPCVSLYQPTHRKRPDTQQDPIRYRNLLREMEASLREKYPTREVQDLLAKFQALARDIPFWSRRTDGLAILGSPGMFQVFALQRPVKELLVVADSFHVKPLLRILQEADRFQILCLNRHEAKLYEGNRDALDPVELKELPSTIEEALGEVLTEPYHAVASFGKWGGGSGKAAYHGHGAKKDEVEIDTDRFFRVIDREILERHSRPSGLPLMLAAPKESHAPFRKVSHNPLLMGDGLHVNPDALSPEQLREMAWRKLEPLFLERLSRLVDGYQLASSRQMGSDDPEKVARAAMDGRIDTLLVEADREIPGRIDASTGRIERGDPSHPAMGDILDDLSEAVLRMKGTVVVVPAERMPVSTGVAATFRF